MSDIECEKCGETGWENVKMLSGIALCKECIKEYETLREAWAQEDDPLQLPGYLVDPIRKTSSENLEMVIAVAAKELQERNSVEEKEIEAGEGEEIVEVQKQSSGPTTVIKNVPCGKECNGCPHGPYEYAVQRDGDDLEWEYIGPVS